MIGLPRELIDKSQADAGVFDALTKQFKPILTVLISASNEGYPIPPKMLNELNNEQYLSLVGWYSSQKTWVCPLIA